MAPVMSKQRVRQMPGKDFQLDALQIATQQVRPAIDALLAALEASVKGCRGAIAEVGVLLDGALQNCTEVLTRCCCEGVLRLLTPPWIRAGSPLTANLPIMFVLQIVVMLYNAFVFGYMPLAGLALNSPTSMVFHALIFMLLSSFVSAVNTDPGSVPDEERWRCYGSPPPELNESKRFSEEWQGRWCQKTDTYKPDRAHHCRGLGRVVLRMDHYCPWIGNTVGFGNHKFFFLFLFYANAACGMLNVSLLELLTHATLPALTKFLIIGSTGLSALLSTLLGPFFLFHCWLLGHNMTTIEFAEQGGKDSGGAKKLPKCSAYDVGLYRNISSVLGDNPLLWMVPIGGPSGDGISFPRRTDVALGAVRPLALPDRQNATAAAVSQSEIEECEDAENPKIELDEDVEDVVSTRIRKGDSDTKHMIDAEELAEASELASSTSSSSTSAALSSSKIVLTRAASELSELTDDFKVGCQFLSRATQESCENFRETARTSVIEVAGTFSDAMSRFTSICAGTSKRPSKVAPRRHSRIGQSETQTQSAMANRNSASCEGNIHPTSLA